MRRRVDLEVLFEEISALTQELSHAVADAAKAGPTPELQRLLRESQRALSAKRRRVIEADRLLDTLTRQNAQLDRLANRDELTGLYNRRSFDRALVRESNRASRAHTRLALLMIDVDHFRELNNTRGHLYGDQCLRSVGAVLREEAGRSTDMTARIGGEEFAVLLPGVAMAAARTLAERIRSGVQSRNLEHDPRDMRRVLTVSVGVASLVPRPHMDPKLLMYVADQALYRAKRAGRDRACAAKEVSVRDQKRLEEQIQQYEIGTLDFC